MIHIYRDADIYIYIYYYIFRNTFTYMNEDIDVHLDVIDSLRDLHRSLSALEMPMPMSPGIGSMRRSTEVALVLRVEGRDQQDIHGTASRRNHINVTLE